MPGTGTKGFSQVRAGGENPQENLGKDLPLKLRTARTSLSVHKSNSGTGGVLGGESSLYKIFIYFKKAKKNPKHEQEITQLSESAAKNPLCQIFCGLFPLHLQNYFLMELLLNYKLILNIEIQIPL